MPVQDTQVNVLIHRRTAIKGLVGLLLLACGSSCASPTSPTVVPTPTAPPATPRPSTSVIHIYRGHTDRVTSVAWSPDGNYIASGSLDKTVQVWKAITGARLYTYRGYNEAGASAKPAKGVLPNFILSLAWSHHGRRIAAVTQQYCSDACGVVLFWDAATGRNVSFYTSTPVFALAWSPDDTRIVTAMSMNLVQVSQVA